MKMRRYLPTIFVSLLLFGLIGAAVRPYRASTAIMIQLLRDDATSPDAKESLDAKQFLSFSKAELKTLLWYNGHPVKVEEVSVPPPTLSHKGPAGWRVFRLTAYNVDRHVAAALANGAARTAIEQLSYPHKHWSVGVWGNEADPPLIHLEDELFQRVVLDKPQGL